MADILELASARISTRALSSLAAAANDLLLIEKKWSDHEGVKQAETLFRISLLCLLVNIPIGSDQRRQMLRELEKITGSSSLFQPLPGMRALPRRKVGHYFTSGGDDDGDRGVLRSASAQVGNSLNDEVKWENERAAIGTAILASVKGAARRAGWTAGNWSEATSTGGPRSISPRVLQAAKKKPRGRDRASKMLVEDYDSRTGASAPAGGGEVNTMVDVLRSLKGVPDGLAGLAARPRLWDVTGGFGSGSRGLAGLGMLGCCASPQQFLTAYKEMRRG